MKHVWASLVLAAMMMTTASAANIKTYRDTCNEGELGCHVILIQGEIQYGDDQKFEGELARSGNSLKGAVVALDSEGGNVTAALSIGRTIHKRGFGTYVFDKCASACAMIWAAGSTIQANPNSKIGFHAAYLLSGSGKRVQVREFGASNALVGAHYAELGYSAEAIFTLTSTSPQNMMWLKASQAVKLGIKVVILDEKAPAFRDKPVKKYNENEVNRSGKDDRTVKQDSNIEYDGNGNRIWPSQNKAVKRDVRDPNAEYDSNGNRVWPSQKFYGNDPE